MPNPRKPIIQTHKHEFFDLSNAQKMIAKRTRLRPDLRALFADAAAQGFKPLVGPKDVMAVKETYRAAQPIKDPSGRVAVQSLEVEFVAQNLGGPRTRDKWAIATISLKTQKPDGSAGPEEAYDMRLVAPAGNLQRPKEFIVTRGKVVQTRSFWSRMKKCLRKKRWCAEACGAALLSCSGTWVVYLACVAAQCGGCWGKCAACAGCRCRFWCKWAVGCCR